MRARAAVRLGLAAAGLLAAFGAGPQNSSAYKASSSKTVQTESARAIPYQSLDPAMRKSVAQVVKNASLFRRMPLHVGECDPDLYRFLTHNPDVIVAMWEALGISQVSLTRTGPNSFEANDGAGTKAQIEACQGPADTQVFYCQGRYEGSMLDRAIEARCVLVLKSRVRQDAEGRSVATTRLDVFIEIPHTGLQIVAKTLQPLIVRSADYNFTETASFISLVSRTAGRNSEKLARLSARMKGIDEARRAEFTQLTGQVAERARQRNEELAARDTPEEAPAARSHDAASAKPSKRTGTTLRR